MHERNLLIEPHGNMLTTQTQLLWLCLLKHGRRDCIRSQCLQSTPLTLKLNTPRLCVSWKRAMRRRCRTTVPVCVLDPAEERISWIFPYRPTFTSSKELYCFYRLHVKRSSARLMAVRLKEGNTGQEKTGVTPVIVMSTCKICHTHSRMTL